MNRSCPNTEHLFYAYFLAQLESLSLIVDEHPSNSGQWLFGLDTLPDSWVNLAALRHLEVRGHQLLDM
jgi:hypothetical protein